MTVVTQSEPADGVVHSRHAMLVVSVRATASPVLKWAVKEDAPGRARTGRESKRALNSRTSNSSLSFHHESYPFVLRTGPRNAFNLQTILQLGKSGA